MHRHSTIALFFLVPTLLSAQSVVYVTNLFDSGSGSFRNAVAIAFPLDTIRFQVTGTITVLNTPITYGQSLVIDGPGMDLLTLDGNDLEVPLRITGGSTWISGLSIVNGRETQGNANTGAGMGFVGDTLVMNDVRISDCAFAGINGAIRYGGGLRVTALRARISDCEFTDNYILDQPSDNGTGYGGGLAITSPDFRIAFSTIKHNTSRSRGSLGAALAHGGGLYLDGTGLVEHCAIDSNTVVSEGYWQGNGGVDAHGYGGGVYIADQSQVIMRSTSVSDNTITLIPNEDPYYFGGGLFVQRADLLMEDCTVNSNHIAPNQPGYIEAMGGGLCVRDGALTLRGCTLDGNIGSRGSAVFFDRANNIHPVHRLIMERTRVANGTGETESAAVHAWPADHVHLSDVELTGNNGRGLAVRFTDTLRVERTLFEGNGNGGAWVEQMTSPDNLFLNCTFEGNFADQGAGLYAYYQTDVRLVNCTFMNDSVPSSQINGREILLWSDCSVDMRNCIISSNVFQPVPAFGSSNSTAVSSGGNIARDASFAGFFTQPTDLNSANPQMGTFDDHGGFTRTWSLAANSTSIDQGGPDTLSVDGRGYLRDGLSDAGAFESGGTDPLLITVSAVSADDTLCVGHPLAVSVNATSGSVIAYQWSLNGSPILGATGPDYAITATLADAGSYTCMLITAGDTVVAGPIEMYVDICTGTAAVTDPEPRIYPQPASDVLHVRDGEVVTHASILTLEGREVRSVQPHARSFSLDLTGLPSGAYVLKLQGREAINTHMRFVKR